MSHWACGVFVSGEYVYVADGDYGLDVYQNMLLGVGEGLRGSGLRYYLGYPEPNPSRGRVLVEYSVPEDGEVILRVYDVAGRRVKDLVSGRVKAGIHRLEWDRRDVRGRLLPSGVYFLRLEAGDRRKVRKLVILR